MKAEQSIAPYYIQFHIGDYVRDCEELSLMQHGAYLKLMLWYYSTAKPIPNQLDRIYRRCGAFSAEERGAVDFVLGEFFDSDGKDWHHKRIDMELEKYASNSKAQRERAKKRWKNNDTTHATAMPGQCHGNANQNQNQNQNQNLEPKPEKTKSKAVGASRAQRLLTTGLPEDWKNFSLQERPDLDPLKTFDTFLDYWTAIPGAKGCKLDWFATWRNWVRNQRTSPAAKTGLQDGAAEYLRGLTNSEKEIDGERF